MKPYLLLILIVVTAGAGCAKQLALREGQRYAACGIEVVFARSTTSFAEGVKPEDSFWVQVDATVSDPNFDVGYLNQAGNFIHVFSGAEGSFETGGGERLYLALRESAGRRMVYDVLEHGYCSLVGSQIEAKQAVLPALDHPYYSSATVLFDLPGGKDVTVTLSASAPNGFTLIVE